MLSKIKANSLSYGFLWADKGKLWKMKKYNKNNSKQQCLNIVNNYGLLFKIYYRKMCEDEPELTNLNKITNVL